MSAFDKSHVRDANRKAIVLHLCARNSPGGNPRRVFVAVSAFDGEPIAVYDEGYGGYPRDLMGAGMTMGPRIDVTPGEYGNWIMMGKEKGILHPS